MTYLVHLCFPGCLPDHTASCEDIAEVKEAIKDIKHDWMTEFQQGSLYPYSNMIKPNHISAKLFERDLDCVVVCQHRHSLYQIQVQRVDDYEGDDD